MLVVDNLRLMHKTSLKVTSKIVLHCSKLVEYMHSENWSTVCFILFVCFFSFRGLILHQWCSLFISDVKSICCCYYGQLRIFDSWRVHSRSSSSGRVREGLVRIRPRSHVRLPRISFVELYVINTKDDLAIDPVAKHLENERIGPMPRYLREIHSQDWRRQKACHCFSADKNDSHHFLAEPLYNPEVFIQKIWQHRVVRTPVTLNICLFCSFVYS